MSDDDPAGVGAAMRKALEDRHKELDERHKALKAERDLMLERVWLPVNHQIAVRDAAYYRVRAANRRMRNIILAVVAAIVLVAVAVATLGAL